MTRRYGVHAVVNSADFSESHPFGVYANKVVAKKVDKLLAKDGYALWQCSNCKYHHKRTHVCSKCYRWFDYLLLRINDSI